MPDQAVDANTPRVGRLDTALKVRRECVALYRDGRTGRLPAVDASRLASVLALVAGMLRDQEIEARIFALEQAVDHAR